MAFAPYRALAFCAILAASAGCSEPTAPHEPTPDTFTADLSGIVESTLEGPVATSGGSGETWRLTLATPSGEERIRFWTRGGVGPLSPGDYALVDSTSAQGGSAPGDYVMARVELAPNSFPDYDEFDFLVGTLTITSASIAGVEGTFNLATSVFGQPTRALVVRGEFRRAY